jgi:hypothetical protein
MSKQEASAVAVTGGTIIGATLAGAVQTIIEAGAISLNTNHAKIAGPDSGTYAVTLAAPSRGGQVLVIEMTGTTGSNAVTLALTNVVGGTAGASASFDAAGETLVLMSMSTKWVVLKEQGVTMS